MQYLKPFVNKKVFVFLPAGGVLRGTLLSIADDHLVMRCKEERRGGGGDKVDVDKFVSRHAIQWVEENVDQRVD